MDLPARIETSAGAETALAAYRSRMPPPPEEGLGFVCTPQEGLEASVALRRLSLVDGPGPRVLVAPRGVLGRFRDLDAVALPSGRLIGTFDASTPEDETPWRDLRPHVVGRWVVEMAPPPRAGREFSPRVWLTETSANVRALGALTERLAEVAEISAMSVAKQLRNEAVDLADFQAELEDEIPRLGRAFLDQWRTEITEADRQAELTHQPAFRAAASLRN